MSGYLQLCLDLKRAIQARLANQPHECCTIAREILQSLESIDEEQEQQMTHSVTQVGVTVQQWQRLREDALMEVAVCGYYCGSEARAESYRCTEELIAWKHTSREGHDHAMDCMRFHIEPLCPTYELCKVFTELPRELDVTHHEKRYALNPSLVVHENGFIMSVRIINYTRDPATHAFTIHDTDNIIRSHTYLLPYDTDLALSSTHLPLQINATAESRLCLDPAPLGAHGLEDMRLFWNNSELWGVCTVPDAGDRTRMALTHLGTPKDIFTLSDTSTTIPPMSPLAFYTLVSPVLDRHEKNWIPISAGQKGDNSHTGPPYLIYSWDPFMLCQPTHLDHPDTVSNLGTECQVTTQLSGFPGDYQGRTYRGGTPGIPWRANPQRSKVAIDDDNDEEMLFIVHEVSPSFLYYHRFVRVDVTERRVTAISKLFYWKELGIEYAAGLVECPNSRLLTVTLGIGDNCVCVVKFAWDVLYKKDLWL